MSDDKDHHPTTPTAATTTRAFFIVDIVVADDDDEGRPPSGRFLPFIIMMFFSGFDVLPLIVTGALSARRQILLQLLPSCCCYDSLCLRFVCVFLSLFFHARKLVTDSMVAVIY